MCHHFPIVKFQNVTLQVYVATVSPARDESAGYVAWGHSTVVDPWGEVVGKAGSSEETIYVDIKLVSNCWQQ